MFLKKTFLLWIIILSNLLFCVSCGKKAQEWYQEGLSYKKTDIKKAIECWDNALKKKPAYIDALREKGLALHELGNFDKTYLGKNDGTYYEQSMECFEKIIKIDPKNSEAWSLKGCILYRKNDYGEAHNCFDKSIELEPKNKLPWIYKGLIFKTGDNSEEAKKCYIKALEIDPNDVDLYDIIASILCSQLKYDEAVSYCNRALLIDPTNMEIQKLKERALKRDTGTFRVKTLLDRSL